MSSNFMDKLPDDLIRKIMDDCDIPIKFTCKRLCNLYNNEMTNICQLLVFSGMVLNRINYVGDYATYKWHNTFKHMLLARKIVRILTKAVNLPLQPIKILNLLQIGYSKSIGLHKICSANVDTCCRVVASLNHKTSKSQKLFESDIHLIGFIAGELHVPHSFTYCRKLILDEYGVDIIENPIKSNEMYDLMELISKWKMAAHISV